MKIPPSNHTKPTSIIQAVTKTIIQTPLLMKPIAHFSHAQAVGNTVYVGAIAGTDAQRRMAGETTGCQDTRAQVWQMMENLKTTLGLVGGSLADLARLKLYVSDPREAALCREAVQGALAHDSVPPSLVVSHGFPLPQAAVELEALAELGTAKERVVTQAGAGVRSAARFFGFAGSGAMQPSGKGAGTSEQIELLRAALIELLFRARVAPSEVVHLRLTVTQAQDVPALDRAIGRIFQAPYPACSVVIAPLEHPLQRFMAEVTAVEGGGVPVDILDGANGLESASTAIMAGDELFIGAQTGTRPDGGAWDCVQTQARRAWQRIRKVLEAAGMDPRDVVQTTNVLTDWRHYAGFNAGYGASVTEPYPSRATVFGQLRDPLALVHTEAVAHRGALCSTVVEASSHAGV